MNTIILLSLAILLLYIFKILHLKYTWEIYPECTPGSMGASAAASVVVAFRNEAENLPLLLSSLKSQRYSAGFFEVILVDDSSEDGSDVIVQQFCEKNPDFRYLTNAGKATGKKAAIETGVKAALYELVVTTDADCIMAENWLQTIAYFYSMSNADMIIGLVDIDSKNSLAGQFQEVEFLSLIASGAGAAAGGKPIYCNAASFAFRKSLYELYSDPMNNSLASGDDTLFLHKAKKKGKKILLLKSSETIVKTRGQKTWQEYVDQRIRWASKSRYYRDQDTIYTALLVLCVNIACVASFVLMIAGLIWWLFPVLIACKTLADFYFLQNFMRFYHKNISFAKFVLFSLVYPFILVFTAIAGLTRGYRWKGRLFVAGGRKVV